MCLGQGQHLFHQGDPVTGFHVVERGAVHLIRHQPDGAPLILQRAGPRSVVAEAALYSETYHCAAVAVGTTQVARLAKSDVLLRLHGNPDFADAWSRHLAHELQNARIQTEILSMKTVAARVDAWIVWRRIAPKKGDWKRIASEISVSPEAFYREMAKRAQN